MPGRSTRSLDISLVYGANLDEQPESTAEMLQRTLHISRVLADKLVAGGISSLDEVAYLPFGELREIGQLWEEEATALRDLARHYLMNEALGDSDENPATGMTDV